MCHGALCLLLLMLCSCAAHKETPDEIALKWKVIDEHVEAKRNAVVPCISEFECKKMFSLAKVFVQQKSDMRIQVIDDTIVSTYGPTDFYLCGMTAVRKPTQNDQSLILLQIECLDRADSVPTLLKKIAIYKEFPAYLRSAEQ